MWRKMPNSIMYCTHLPPKVNSLGIWSNSEDPVLEHSLPLLQLQVFLLFTITEALHLILKHLSLPRLVSQVLAGLLMGPEIFGNFEKLSSVIFPILSIQTNEMLGLFSYVLFVFTIGVRIDFSLVFTAGKIAFFNGILGVAIPGLVGIAINKPLAKYFLLSEKEAISLLHLVSLLATTQFTDIILVLEDLKIINSELGRLCMSSGMVGSAFSIAITYLNVISRVTQEMTLPMGIVSGMIVIGFIIVLKIVVRPTMYWIISQTPEGRPVKGIYIYSIIAVALISGLLTSEVGHYIPLGAFLFGLAVPSGPPLGSAFVHKLDGFLSSFLLPFFVSNTMMTVRFRHVISNIMHTSSITCVAVWLAKFLACLAPPLYTKMPTSDAFIVASILSSKSIAELALFSMVENSKMLMKETFVVLPFMLLFTSLVTSLLMKFFYDPSRKYANYRKRNIMSCQNQQYMKVLACIYKSDDMYNIIDLLDASNPTHGSPIHVDVLHLIELVGRASPIFISHQLQTKVLSNKPYSEQIINTFTEYQNLNINSVFVNIFTAISPLKLMDEDICTLAFDKQAAIILLPFHRKWALDGSLELEDNSKRTLNNHVLEKAPCSVGIVIECNNDRTNSSKSTINVFTIFIGGNDDREALTLAKRTRTNPSINLTVLRLASDNDNTKLDWSEMLDAEVLKELKAPKTKPEDGEGEGGEVRYIEEIVSDGGKTVKVMQAIGSTYDVVIVGRRHNVNCAQISGLVEWSEYHELGVLGDLLVSPSSHLKGLVLVVQQQLT